MWLKKSCYLSNRKMIMLVTLVLLMVSINSFFIRFWCTNEAPKKSQKKFNKFSNISKFKKINSSKIRSYAPDEFYTLDCMLTYPIIDNKNPEPIACDNYLGNPNDIQFGVQDQWKFIDNGEYNETYIYSSYYDPRLDPPVIKIFGMSSGVTFNFDTNFSPDRKYCYVWFKKNGRPDVMVADYEIIPETHGRIYAASIHHCVLSRRDVPFAVALSAYKCRRQKQFLKVTNNLHYIKENIYNFTVCVSPFSFRYNNVGQLVESIEINRLFGADHFTFYDYSIEPPVAKVLESYVSDELVEVLKWDVPVNVDTNPPDPTIEVEIHYFAQLVSLNDCLYRNMFKSKFIVFSDLDELIVPQLHDNWFDMIRHATAQEEAERVLIQSIDGAKIFPGTYLVRNVFFPLQWEGNRLATSVDRKRFEEFQKRFGLTRDVVDKAVEYKMNSVLATKCEQKSYNWYIRSKYIVWSQVVGTVTVHQAQSFISSHKVLQVPVNQHTGLLHHYRDWDANPAETSSRSCSRLHHFIPQYFQKIIERLDVLDVHKLR